MHSFKKFWAWIAGPKSDLVLFFVIIVLANLIGARAFFRLDLTEQSSYSLSQASRELVSSLEEPVSVRVYFTKNLPSPYNSVESYLSDLLSEYQGKAGKNRFSYEFVDMEDPEARSQAMNWGLQNVQIQEVKDTEVGLKTAWMGLVILYGDGAEVIDNLTGTEGLEYKLTTTIARMIAMNDTLAGLDGSISLTLYASSALSRFNIGGFAELPAEVQTALDTLNKRNRNRIVYSRIDPAQDEIEMLAAKYGVQVINWSAGRDGTSAGMGTLGLVLSRGERFVSVPLELTRGIFGGYSIRNLGNLSDTLAEALQSLLSRSVEMAYLTGQGEKSLWDGQSGAYRLQALVKDRYTLKEYATVREVPATVHSIMINGPRTAFSEEDLYALDQFLMRGGNLVLLLDPINEVMPDQQMLMYGAQPTYEPIDTGLQKLLAAWGIELSASYVMDKACYVAKQQGVGELPLYYVPQLAKESLNAKHPVSKNLAYVLFLQAGALSQKDGRIAEGVSYTPLASTSDEAWIPDAVTSLNPYAIMPPAADAMAKHDLAVALEGIFPSAYESSPVAGIREEESSGETGDAAAGSTDSAAKSKPAPSAPSVTAADLSATAHLSKSAQRARVAVFGSSAITTPSVMDENGSQPVALLLRNAIDWANGNDELIPMRTKGLGLNTLDKTTKEKRDALRAVNLYGLPALVALAGLAVWRLRVARRRRIRELYCGAERTINAERTTNGEAAQ